MAENWPIIAVSVGIVLYEAYRRGAIKLGGGKKPVPVPTPVVPDGGDDTLGSLDRLRAAYVAADEAAASAVTVRDEAKAAYQAALDQADVLIEKAKAELDGVPKPEVPTDAD